jgi:hypothetical protein
MTAALAIDNLTFIHTLAVTAFQVCVPAADYAMPIYAAFTFSRVAALVSAADLSNFCAGFAIACNAFLTCPTTVSIAAFPVRVASFAMPIYAAFAV